MSPVLLLYSYRHRNRIALPLQRAAVGILSEDYLWWLTAGPARCKQITQSQLQMSRHVAIQWHHVVHKDHSYFESPR